MDQLKTALIFLATSLILSSCATSVTPEENAWRDQLRTNLATLGARNWIVIAESSFPSYTGAGVSTMTTSQSSPEIFLQVLDSLERGGYVQPRIMVASELSGIEESYAPGIKRYRSQINNLLPGRMHFELPARIINGQIEDAIKQFKVLVIKTSTTLPYSNIYIELDSGYWNTDAETALRTKLEGSPPAPAPKTPEDIQATPVSIPQPPLQQDQTPPTNDLPELPRENDAKKVSPSLTPVSVEKKQS